MRCSRSRRSAPLAPILLVLTAGLLPPPAAAQQFTGAMKIGLAATTITGETEADFAYRTGLAGGVAFGYDFGNGLLLQPELIYVTKGATAAGLLSDLLNPSGDTSVPDVPIDLTFTLTYLEVPLLAVYRLETLSGLHPRVFAGPAFGFKLDALVSYRAQSGGAEFTDNDPSVDRYDYGVVLGAGLDVDTSFNRLVVEARATLGRANIRDNDARPLRNTGFVVMVGLVY